LVTGESTVGESALRKNFDALRMLPVDSPLLPQIPHVLAYCMKSRGYETGVTRMRGRAA
jgi:hypothetical protein